MLPLVVVFPISLSSAPYMQFPPPGFSIAVVRALSRRSAMDRRHVPLALYRRRHRRARRWRSACRWPSAWRAARFAGRALLDRVALAPLVVPTIILSVGLYGLFAKLKLIGEWYGLVAGAHRAGAAVRRAGDGGRPARLRPRARAGGRGAGRQPRADPAAGHAAAAAAEPGLGRPAGLHLVVRRAGRRAVPGRAEHDLAQEDVRQHPDGDRSDDRRGVGDADPAGLDRARPDRPLRPRTAAAARARGSAMADSVFHKDFKACRGGGNGGIPTTS